MADLLLPGWTDLLDIAVVAGFAWLAIRYFRRTRARAALAGLALLGLVYLVARGFELRLTQALFQAFFTVLVLVLVVVFQEDLRRVFEQLGGWWRGRKRREDPEQALDVLVRVVSRLASTRTGALIVLPGREPLERHLDGGVELQGRLSEPLLLSLFDASSPGHDGAVLLRQGRVERFAVHLPLSPNRAALGNTGTRHAAALGLAERCDATCIVVSEERGTVSFARDGAIETLANPEELVRLLGAPIEKKPAERRWWQGPAARDVGLAVGAASLLWVALVPGADVAEITLSAPVEVTNLPEGQRLAGVEPASVDVTLRGLRRDLLLARRAGVSVRIDAYLARLGRRTFSVRAPDVHGTDGLSIVELQPERVKLSLVSSDSPKEPDGS